MAVHDIRADAPAEFGEAENLGEDPLVRARVDAATRRLELVVEEHERTLVAGTVRVREHVFVDRPALDAMLDLAAAGVAELTELQRGVLAAAG